jgi:phenylacetic acid degradation operon negative regulatory protein
MNLTLSQKILIFLRYCLKEAKYDFSAKNLAKIFKEVYKDDYSLGSIHKEMSLLKTKGLIEYQKRYRKPLPILTRKGQLAIASHLPFKKYGHWDGKWRLVCFEIPEREKELRHLLRQRLLKLGFGKLQDSVYLSPYPLFAPIKRFAGDYGAVPYIKMLEIAKIEDEKETVEEVWEIKKIAERYHDFIQNAAKMKKGFWPLWAKKLERDFAQIYQDDPHLPEEFLHQNWPGERAYKVFKEIVRSY